MIYHKFLDLNIFGHTAHCYRDMQTIKERRSYERRSRFHEREVSAAHIFKKERKKSAAHSIS